MNAAGLLAAVAVVAVSPVLSVSQAGAQTSQARTRPAAAAPASAPAAETQQKCLRALNGACTNATSVEEARLRAMVIPAAQVSYLGTPAGTIGGDYIPFGRLFQDNPLLYGLPTFTLVTPCCVTRTK